MPIKNIWSLNIDELLVADKLKAIFNKKDFDVFFPLNSQLKGIDLLLVNFKENFFRSIQVKGSRTYEPSKVEIIKYGEGRAAWFAIKNKVVFELENRPEYYIFVLHNIIEDKNLKRKIINIDHLVVPTEDFLKICTRKKPNNRDMYNFFIWIDVKGKRSFDFRDGIEIDLSQYLNNWQIIK